MINGERVKQARELRGFTQTELAHRVNTTQANIAHIEAGRSQPSANIIAGIALQTGFPLAFFRQETKVDFPLGSLMFRSRSMAAIDRSIAHRYGQITAEIALDMAGRVNTLPLRLPRTGEKPAKAAQITRAALSLSPDRPIPNLVHAVERAGVLVLMLPVAIRNADAFSVWTGEDAQKPTIVLFGEAPGDRQRLSLSHEIAHLVLHLAPRGNVNDVEREAYDFAGELLMPEVAMRQEMTPPVTLTSLAEMKSQWGVSIQALLLRAYRLGIIAKHQYNYLHAQIRKKGWLYHEPSNLDVPMEKPRAVRKMAELLYGKPIDYQHLAADAKISVQFAHQIIESHASREDLSRRTIKPIPANDEVLPPSPLSKVSAFRQRGEWDGRNTKTK